jgi:predicted DNA-binding transcriptional regulator YafY
MSRTARLLELLTRVQTKHRFTAAELAEEFGVSRRTMLRDLAALWDGRAFAVNARSRGRLLVASWREEALAFPDRGRGARADRLLRGPAQVPGAPLLHQ